MIKLKDLLIAGRTSDRNKTTEDYRRKPSEPHPSKIIWCPIHGKQMKLGIHCAKCEQEARKAAKKEKKKK
jgi:hypothetical protein